MSNLSDSVNDDDLDKLIQETQQIWKTLGSTGIDTQNDSNSLLDANITIPKRLQASSNLNFTLTTPTPERQKTANRIINLNNQLSSFETTVQNANSRLLEGLNLETPLTLENNSNFTRNNNNDIDNGDITNNFYANFNDTTFSNKLKFSTPTFDSYRKVNKNANKEKLSSNNKSQQNRIYKNFTFNNIGNSNGNSHNTDKTNNNNNNNNNNDNNESNTNVKQSQSAKNINNRLGVSFPSPINVSPLSASNARVNRMDRMNRTNQNKIDKIDKIDFNNNIWNEVNSMLKQCNFDILMNDDNSMPSQMIVCNRFIQVLTDYKLLFEKSNDFEKQMTLLNDKLKEYKIEMTQLKQFNETNENNNQIKYLNLQRQYNESQKIILNKENEITKLKNKIETFIEIDNKRKENVSLIYQSLNIDNKKKLNKNKSYNSQIMDIISVFDNERKKLTQENKLLKQEIRKLTNSINDNNEKSKKQKCENISICQSNRESDNEDNDTSNDTSNNKKLFNIASNINDIDGISNKERRNNLHKMEIKRLMSKIEFLENESNKYKTEMQSLKQENAEMKKDIESRPTQTEWIKLRKTLNKMNKELKDAQSAADLRQYMETRELIKRDKDIFNLKLYKIENIPNQILKEIMIDICRILSINDVTSVIKTIESMSKVVETVPILEQFITRIVRIMISSDHCPNLVKIQRLSPKQVFNHVIPTLQEWIINLDKVKTLENFKMTMNNIISKRTVGQSTLPNKIDNNDENNNDKITVLPLHDMARQVRELIESEEFLLSAKETFVNLETRLNDRSNPPTMEQKIITHFMKLFEVNNVNGIFAKMNAVYIELNEMRNVINTLKSMLNIEKNASINLCFSALQTIIDNQNENEYDYKSGNKNINNKKNDNMSDNNSENNDKEELFFKWNEIMLDLTKILQCNENELISTIKELNERCIEYDAVFPRVQNLVNQLRSTLGVEHAHQILPKVKQLCAASIGIHSSKSNA